MLKIYGRANSINVRKVLWTVDELSIPYEREDWGRGYQPVTNPAFLALNEFALVPAIDDDGFVLSESNAIIRYLAAKHGRDDLLPADIKDRAIVERWMDWQISNLYAALRPAVQGLMFKMALPGGQDAIEASLNEWVKEMQPIEDQLRRTAAYIIGDIFTLADVCIGLTVNRWYAMNLPIERPDFPAMAAYYDRLSERPAFLAHGRNGLP